MRRPVLSVLGGILVLAAAGQAVMLMDGFSRLAANAEPPEMMAGCTDIPEAVTLAETLRERSLRLDGYMQELDRKKAEIAFAEKQLTEKLVELRKVKQQLADRDAGQRQSVTEDISRLIAVYDQMKPEQAAVVLSNMLADATYGALDPRTRK